MDLSIDMRTLRFGSYLRWAKGYLTSGRFHRSSINEIRKVAEMSEKWEVYVKLQSPPRNSALTRLHRHCLATESAKANYRHFGLSAHILREMVHTCLLPGETRLSW